LASQPAIKPPSSLLHFFANKAKVVAAV